MQQVVPDASLHALRLVACRFGFSHHGRHGAICHWHGGLRLYHLPRQPVRHHRFPTLLWRGGPIRRDGSGSLPGARLWWQAGATPPQLQPDPACSRAMVHLLLPTDGGFWQLAHLCAGLTAQPQVTWLCRGQPACQCQLEHACHTSTQGQHLPQCVQDKTGTFARTATDAAVVLDAIRGRDPCDLSSFDTPLQGPFGACFGLDTTTLTVGYVDDKDWDCHQVGVSWLHPGAHATCFGTRSFLTALAALMMQQYVAPGRAMPFVLSQY